MAGSFVKFGIVMTIFGIAESSTRFNCYACSYTFSSAATVDYECATDPQNVTRGLPQISCQAPYLCSTQANFFTGMKQIRSVSRSCRPQQEICSGDKCCNMDGMYPTCEHKCREELCNGLNAEEWLSSGVNFRDNTESGSGNGASGENNVDRLWNIVTVLSLTLACVL